MTAAGIGLASQMVEGFAHSHIKGVARKAVGRMGGSIGCADGHRNLQGSKCSRTGSVGY